MEIKEHIPWIAAMLATAAAFIATRYRSKFLNRAYGATHVLTGLGIVLCFPPVWQIFA